MIFLGYPGLDTVNRSKSWLLVAGIPLLEIDRQVGHDTTNSGNKLIFYMMVSVLLSPKDQWLLGKGLSPSKHTALGHQQPIHLQ